MPYKDLERKKEWERLHRPQRLARRRELRRIAAAQQATRPDSTRTNVGGALAAYNPKLGMTAGGATLAVAAIFKKNSGWWIVGALILAVGLFFYWHKQQSVKSRSEKKNKEPGSGPNKVIQNAART